jgi:hypothetical protein
MNDRGRSAFVLLPAGWHSSRTAGGYIMAAMTNPWQCAVLLKSRSDDVLFWG